MTDDVLQEVRAAREAFARLHGYNAYEMVAALRRMNEAGDWTVVRLPPRPPTEIAAVVKPSSPMVNVTTADAPISRS